jgi:hypothetical protein
MNEIRTLRADEIECRVQQITEKGCVLLIYKDARCDMKILDEIFGSMNWQRSHEVINDNLFCNIEIWDNDKKQWVRKQDVGIESNTEKEKGEASDSFKRAGFNVGIGRELYTAPFIWINLDPSEITEKKQLAKGIKFEVKSIGYNSEKEIISLVIVDNKGKERFSMCSKTQIPTTPQKPIEPTKTPEQKADWAEVDGDMNDLKTLTELKAYWAAHKSWQIAKEFIELKNKHKQRLNETKTE